MFALFARSPEGGPDGLPVGEGIPLGVGGGVNAASTGPSTTEDE